MFVVGLTGGIGSGKSTVADLFAKQGVNIIDTDVIARELVAPGQHALHALVEHFTQDILNPDGSLNRKALRAHIFAHPHERRWLEALLHPLIQQEVKNRLQHTDSAYTVVVIPLLTENYRQSYPFLDRICVVDSEEHVQIERTVTRDGITREMAQQMLNSQPSREQRLSLATDLIINNHDLSALASQVMALHTQYLKLCMMKS